MRALILIGALLWSGAAFAELPAADADGWYSWVIDNEEQTVVNVRLKDGELTGLRVQNFYINCYQNRAPKTKDLGVVTAAENFRWFKRYVEDVSADRDSRESALVGVVQSGSDEAFDYVEALINAS